MSSMTNMAIAVDRYTHIVKRSSNQVVFKELLLMKEKTIHIYIYRVEPLELL